MSDFEVVLFEVPVIRSAIRDIHLSPFQTALVSLVFSEGTVVRPRAVKLLWEALDGSKERHRLRQLVHAINQRVGTKLIRAEGDVLVAPGDVCSDVRAFEDDLAEDRLLSAARGIVRGFAMGEFAGLPDAFHDWRDAQEADRRKRVVALADAKWETSRNRDDWPSARDAAEATYCLRPHAEQSVARVIEARARTGKVRSAEVAYAHFQAAHDREPSSALDALMGRIRRVEETLVEEEHTEAPFVGRHEELLMLRPVYAGSESCGATLTLITGEAGIGKTRLLDELHRFAQIEGVRCLRAQSSELEQQIFLNPILDALRGLDLDAALSALGEPWRSVVGGVLPANTLSGPLTELPAIEEGSLPRRLFDAFSMVLESLASEQPTLLLLDDFQWADATTVALVDFFLRRWPNCRLGIVAAMRTNVDADAPARHFLAGEGSDSAQTLSLVELDIDSARELIDHLGRDSLTEDEAIRLLALAGGHPLFLTELIKDYLEGRLEFAGPATGELSVPISIRQILAARLGGLETTAQRICEILAAAARPMRLSSLATVLQVELDDAADAAEIVRASRLAEVERDRIWIAHDLFRSGIYALMSESKRAVLHLRVAELIQQTEGDDISSELALHFHRGGEASQAAHHAWIAANRAFEQGAMAEAVHFYELAAQNAADPRRQAKATGRMATALHLARDASRANPALELAASRLRAVGQTELARRIEIRRVEALAETGLLSVDDLVERLRAIKSEATRAEDWEAVALGLDVELRLLQLHERLAGVRGLRSQFEQVIDEGSAAARAVAYLGLAVGLLLDEPDRAVDAARTAVGLTESIAPGGRLQAINRLLMIFMQRGLIQLPECALLRAEARSLAEASGDLLQRFSLEANMGVAHLDAGDLDEAEAHFDRADGLLGTAHMTFPRINLACNRAELAIARGDYIDAAAQLRSVGDLSGSAVPKYTAQVVTAGLGLCALELGAMAEARAHEDALSDPPSTWYYDPTIELTFRSQLLARRGRYDEAEQLLADAASALKGHLVMAYLKTRLVQLRVMTRGRLPGVANVAREARATCAEMGLRTREAEFASFVRASR